MPIPSLPIELCESIIDASTYVQDYGREMSVDHRTLLACALTCKAWHPRSIYNFYHMVILSGGHQARRIVQWLRQPQNLTLRIYHLYNPTRIYQGHTSSFYLVPHHLSSLPPAILKLGTLEIGSGPAGGYNPARLTIGEATNDTFLRSYASRSFRSVHTLSLYAIVFQTFPYFA